MFYDIAPLARVFRVLGAADFYDARGACHPLCAAIESAAIFRRTGEWSSSRHACFSPARCAVWAPLSSRTPYRSRPLPRPHPIADYHVRPVESSPGLLHSTCAPRPIRSMDRPEQDGPAVYVPSTRRSLPNGYRFCQPVCGSALVGANPFSLLPLEGNAGRTNHRSAAPANDPREQGRHLRWSAQMAVGSGQSAVGITAFCILLLHPRASLGGMEDVAARRRTVGAVLLSGKEPNQGLDSLYNMVDALIT